MTISRILNFLSFFKLPAFLNMVMTMPFCSPIGISSDRELAGVPNLAAGRSRQRAQTLSALQRPPLLAFLTASTRRRKPPADWAPRSTLHFPANDDKDTITTWL